MKKPITFVVDDKGCFNVNSHCIGREGYPIIKRNGRMWLLHRLIYTQNFGDIPLGLLVCHRCDNKKCINPEHFFLGTYRDNTQDAIKKGLQGKGNTKLTIQELSEIKSSVGITNASLARKFGVSKARIGQIRKIQPE
jgi:hypothetical protein